ncbi:CMRF35-like molecule 9 isoform X2 [Phacochoerus africanus]|uniref:CMRF35-like molecule 9 isoform X2 n=1 Tax=Phacochoerus africanus TaxID=41426 RepID=UPI001FDA5EDF|nr:CMRF35-like molecule 9 isoform X2 [Phacochoerus africanus]
MVRTDPPGCVAGGMVKTPCKGTGLGEAHGGNGRGAFRSGAGAQKGDPRGPSPAFLFGIPPLEEVEAPRSAAVERSSQLPVCAPARPALTMRPLVLLWACLVLPGYGTLVGPKEISGFVGDTVSLQCTYGEALKTHRKYWCRKIGYLIARCSGTVFSGGYGQDGRVSVHDSPRELRFKVILRNLTLEDEGQYFCGIQRLGLDDSFSVSLHIFPASPGLHLTVSTAKLGKTGAEASPSAGTFPSEHLATSPHAGTSPYAGISPFARTTPHPATSPYAGASAFARSTPHPATSPYAGTTPHPATSPPAGISRPTTQLDSTSAKDTSLVRRSSTVKSGTSIPMTRILAPVLVLLALLLATGLAALGSWVLQRRKEAQLTAETERKEKLQLSHSASEEDGACLRDPEGDVTPGPPLPVSGEGPGLSEFISG